MYLHTVVTLILCSWDKRIVPIKFIPVQAKEPYLKWAAALRGRCEWATKLAMLDQNSAHRLNSVDKRTTGKAKKDKTWVITSCRADGASVCAARWLAGGLRTNLSSWRWKKWGTNRPPPHTKKIYLLLHHLALWHIGDLLGHTKLSPVARLRHSSAFSSLHHFWLQLFNLKTRNFQFFFFSRSPLERSQRPSCWCMRTHRLWCSLSPGWKLNSPLSAPHSPRWPLCT